jgi:hypothetical protein
LDELQRRVWAYQSARFDALKTAYDASDTKGVYVLDQSEPPEANLHLDPCLRDNERFGVMRSARARCRSI